MQNKRKVLIIAVALVVASTGLFFAISNVLDYFDGVNEAERLKALHDEAARMTVITDSSRPASSQEEGDAAEEQPDTIVGNRTVRPEYTELINVNPEVIGWIKVDGTRIDYPMLQHVDNEYYLHASIDNKKSKRGCVYIDYRNNSEVKDKNTLIYAHNMKDGSMFHDLVQYKKKAFFDAHRKIHINNLYETGIWEVFSVYVVDADKETIDIDYSAEGSFMKAMEGFKKRSMFETGTEITENDRIVTLVTCSYETSNSRTIVHAKYIGPEE